MACDLRIKFPKEEIVLKKSVLKNADLTQITQILKQLPEEQLADITNQFMEASTSSIQTISEDDLKQGIVGNTTILGLQTQFPSIDFPTKIDNPPNILLVESLKINGSELDGRYIQNGQEIYVVKNNKASLQHLARYLKIRNSIDRYIAENNPLDSSGRPFTREDIVSFINNPSIWEQYSTDFLLLKNIVRELYGLPQINISNIDVGIYSRLKQNKKARTSTIKSSELFIQIAEQLDLNNGWDRLGNVQHNANGLWDVVYNRKGGIRSLNNLLSLIGSTFKVVDTNDKFTVINYVDPSIDSQPEVMNTKSLLTPVKEYKGFNVYKTNSGKFTYSEYLLTTEDEVMQSLVDSEEEVEKNIDRYINTKRKKLNSSLQVNIKMNESGLNNFIQSKYNIKEGTIIQVYNIMGKFNAVIPAIDRTQFIIQLKQAIPDKLRELNDIRDLNLTFSSNESCVAFLQLLDAPFNKIAESKNLLEAYRKIAHMKPELRLISSTTNLGKGKYLLKTIPIYKNINYKPFTVTEKPMFQLIKDIADDMYNKFGIETELVSDNDLTPEFRGSKAFIKDGKVYINTSNAKSSDLMHEYIHLFLGVLKANNFDLYQNMMRAIVYNPKAQTKKAQLKSLYKGLADVDLDEEVFADLFSDYLAGSNIFSNVFNNVKKELDNQLKSIIKANDADFSELYNMSIYDVFSRFSNYVKDSGDLDFSKGTVYRKASNYIAQELRNSNIIEQC